MEPSGMYSGFVTPSTSSSSLPIASVGEGLEPSALVADSGGGMEQVWGIDGVVEGVWLPKEVVMALKRPWQAEFASILALPSSTPPLALEKGKKLFHLVRSFEKVAVHVAEVVLKDRESGEERLKGIRGLGIAGGEKFVCGSLFVKWASSDWLGLYGGDGMAAKAASHELKGVSAVISSGVAGVAVPLMATVDVHGHRLIVSSRLEGISAHTLVYGSADAGRTIHTSDPKTNDRLRRIGLALNLAPHIAGKATNTRPKPTPTTPTPPTSAILWGPADLEGHCARSGRGGGRDGGREGGSGDGEDGGEGGGEGRGGWEEVVDAPLPSPSPTLVLDCARLFPAEDLIASSASRALLLFIPHDSSLPITSTTLPAATHWHSSASALLHHPNPFRTPLSHGLLLTTTPTKRKTKKKKKEEEEEKKKEATADSSEDVLPASTLYTPFPSPPSPSPHASAPSASEERSGKSVGKSVQVEEWEGGQAAGLRAMLPMGWEEGEEEEVGEEDEEEGKVKAGGGDLGGDGEEKSGVGAGEYDVAPPLSSAGEYDAPPLASATSTSSPSSSSSSPFWNGRASRLGGVCVWGDAVVYMSQGGFLTRLLREEAVRSSPVALSSDAGSGFGWCVGCKERRGCLHCGEEHKERVRKATARSCEDEPQAFARDIDHGRITLTGSHRLVAHMHKAGINLRFLGRVRASLETPWARALLLTEMLARVARTMLRAELRRSSNAPTTAQRFLNLLLGHSPQSDTFWQMLKRASESKFGTRGTEKDLPQTPTTTPTSSSSSSSSSSSPSSPAPVYGKDDLRGSVGLRQLPLAVRVCELCGIELPPRLVADWAQNPQLLLRPHPIPHPVPLRPTVKSIMTADDLLDLFQAEADAAKHTLEEASREVGGSGGEGDGGEGGSGEEGGGRLLSPHTSLSTSHSSHSKSSSLWWLDRVNRGLRQVFSSTSTASPALCASETRLAQAYLLAGCPDKAEVHARAACAAGGGAWTLEAVVASVTLAEALERRGDVGNAVALFQGALRDARAVAPLHPVAGKAAACLARTLLAKHSGGLGSVEVDASDHSSTGALSSPTPTSPPSHTSSSGVLAALAEANAVFDSVFGEQTSALLVPLLLAGGAEGVAASLGHTLAALKEEKKKEEGGVERGEEGSGKGSGEEDGVEMLLIRPKGEAVREEIARSGNVWHFGGWGGRQKADSAAKEEVERRKLALIGGEKSAMAITKRLQSSLYLIEDFLGLKRGHFYGSDMEATDTRSARSTLFLQPTPTPHQPTTSLPLCTPLPLSQSTIAGNSTSILVKLPPTGTIRSAVAILKAEGSDGEGEGGGGGGGEGGSGGDERSGVEVEGTVCWGEEDGLWRVVFVFATVGKYVVKLDVCDCSEEEVNEEVGEERTTPPSPPKTPPVLECHVEVDAGLLDPGRGVHCTLPSRFEAGQEILFETAAFDFCGNQRDSLVDGLSLVFKTGSRVFMARPMSAEMPTQFSITLPVPGEYLVAAASHDQEFFDLPPITVDPKQASSGFCDTVIPLTSFSKTSVLLCQRCAGPAARVRTPCLRCENIIAPHQGNVALMCTSCSIRSQGNRCGKCGGFAGHGAMPAQVCAPCTRKMIGVTKCAVKKGVF